MAESENLFKVTLVNENPNPKFVDLHAANAEKAIHKAVTLIQIKYPRLKSLDTDNLVAVEIPEDRIGKNK